MNVPDRIPRIAPEVWFLERYHDAANQVIEFFGAEFFGLTGKSVADIGCGDGIIDLGVANKARPERLVGFDLLPVNTGLLADLAASSGMSPALPQGLSFCACPAECLAAEDESFDFVFSWSAFHHIADPLRALGEIRRVLRPEGALMIQVYPFYDSAHGSLLEQWFPEGFAQFLLTENDRESAVQAEPGDDPAWTAAVLEASRGLNRLSLDSLGEMLAVVGLRMVRIELIAEGTRVPPPLAGRPLSRLGVGGVKLLAVKG